MDKKETAYGYAYHKTVLYFHIKKGLLNKCPFYSVYSINIRRSIANISEMFRLKAFFSCNLETK